MSVKETERERGREIESDIHTTLLQVATAAMRKICNLNEQIPRLFRGFPTNLCSYNIIYSSIHSTNYYNALVNY